MFYKKKSLLYVACGIIIGILMFFSSASFFYLMVIVSVGYFIYNRVDDCEKTFILRVFSFGLFLRLVFIVVTHILSIHYGFGPKSLAFPGMEGGAIFGDDIGIHQNACFLTKIANGVNLSEKETIHLFKFGEYGWSPHLYMLGFLYYLFGYAPMLGKCINGLFGVLTGIVVYFMSNELFGIKTARLSCILTMFFPTLFLWSISNLRDMALIFLLTLFLYSYVMFLKIRRMRYLFLVGVLFLLVSNYRPYLLPLLICSAATAIFINIGRKYKKLIISVVVLVFLLNSYFVYKYHINQIITIPRSISIGRFIEIQRGSVNSGGTIYKIYPDRFYNSEDYKPISAGESIIAFLNGELSLMLKPFPWDISNKFKFFYYPVSVVWDILFVFFIVSLLVNVRYRIKGSIFLISTFIMISVLLSLTEGNIGTMIRHRDMITPVYIIFSSFGIVWLLSGCQLKTE